MSHPVETIRHSLSHVMAEAVLKLYPGTKVGIGPAIDDGFYYDFQFSEPHPAGRPSRHREGDAPHHCGRALPSCAKEVSKAEAQELFADGALQD